MGKEWEDLTADEKTEAYFEKLMSPKDGEGNDLQFQSPEAEADFKARLTRVKDAIQLREPDRVPVTILPSTFPYLFAGITAEEAMYDYDKCTAAFKEFILEFEPDMHIGASMPGPGTFYEALDYKLYAWPGHGVAPEHSYQCNEDEYMKPDEYDLMMTDPSFYWRNVYMPRIMGALEGFRMLAPWTSVLEMYGLAFQFVPFGLPPVQESFQALFEAGAEALKWAQAMGQSDAEIASLGYPTILGGFTKAPFDVIGDTLRGTKGIMLDIFRRPNKLLAAMDALVPIMISMGVNAAQQTGKPFIFMPLHKGADGFLSDEHFKEFYWPTLRQVMMGLIDEGCIPFPALEGHWETRLEIIQDVPKGKTAWMVDQSDMERVNETLGQKACLIGNVPSSTLSLGTPEDVRAYVKDLIDIAAPGGGFMVSNGAFFDEAKPENVKAMVETTKEYGVYD